KNKDIVAEWDDEPAVAPATRWGETGPSIVALIENGQPKPSARPFVHASREAAETEASRLAGKHPGKEFGVYELVATKREEVKHEWQKLALAGDRAAAVDALVKVAGIRKGDAWNAVF